MSIQPHTFQLPEGSRDPILVVAEEIYAVSLQMGQKELPPVIGLKSCIDKLKASDVSITLDTHMELTAFAALLQTIEIVSMESPTYGTVH